MGFENFVKTRSAGFWLTAAISFTATLTAIIYGACYASAEELSIAACVLTAVCAASVGLAFTRFKGMTPYLQLLFVLAAFGFYAHSVYYYVSVVLVGIDLDTFSPEFITCTVLFAALIAASAVNVFFGQGAKVAEGEKE